MHPGILIKLKSAIFIKFIRNLIFDPGLIMKFFSSIKIRTNSKVFFWGGTRTNNFDSLTQGLITKVYCSNKKLKKNENSFFERLFDKKNVLFLAELLKSNGWIIMSAFMSERAHERTSPYPFDVNGNKIKTFWLFLT
jgi:hypothetical protein